MALSYAAEGGDVEVVAKLVELGAEVDGADKVRVKVRVKVGVRVKVMVRVRVRAWVRGKG